MNLSELPIIVHDLAQGSPEWHRYRAVHFNAGDAAAMMGCSPHTSRDELKLRLFNGIEADVDDVTQARYDNGHRIEKLARPFGEDALMEALLPMVVSRGKYSASLDGAVPPADPDGIRFTILWEHKQLNETLRGIMTEGATGADLPKFYRVQMEQQLMVTDAAEVLFTASDWDGETLIDIRHVTYVSDPELRADIITGWQLLEDEMVDYAPPLAGAIAIARTYSAMPPLEIRVSGVTIVEHNFPVYLDRLNEFVAAAPKDPRTDQDFADVVSAGKKGRDVAKLAIAQEEELMRKASSLNGAVEILRTIADVGNKLGSSMEKLAESHKKVVLGDMVTKARAELVEEVKRLNAELRDDLMPAVPQVVGELAAAVKNRRSFKSAQEAVNEAKSLLMVAARRQADAFAVNLAVFRAIDGKHLHLFRDKASILTKPADDFAVLVKMRCSEFDTEEAKRVEDEKKRIKASAQQAAAAAVSKAHAQARFAEAGADVEFCDKTIAALSAQVFQEESYGSHCEALSASRDQALEVARSARSAAIAKAEVAAAAAPPAPAPAPVAPAPAPAPSPAPAAPAPTVFQMASRALPAAAQPAPATDGPANLLIGTINVTLGYTVSASFLAERGFQPARIDGARRFYRDSDLPLIGQAIARHTLQVTQLQAVAA